MVTSMRLKPCDNRAGLWEAGMSDGAEIFMNSVQDWECEKKPGSLVLFAKVGATYKKPLLCYLRKNFFYCK